MLEPLLEEVDHLILAGDVWQQRRLGLGRGKALKKYEALKNLVSERGVRLEILRGNHDPEGGAGVTWLEDGAVLVTHGDAIYDEATPWSREMGHYHEQVVAVVKKYERQCHLAAACAERAREIALTLKPLPLPSLPPPFNFLATALWPPRRTFEMLRVWRGMGKQGLRFLEHSGEGAQVLVCGHFHRAGIWEARGRVFINTGAFMKGSRPWAVDLNAGEMTARELTLWGGVYRLGEVKGRWLL